MRRTCWYLETQRGDGDDARFRILALGHREAADVADVTVWRKTSSGTERPLEDGRNLDPILLLVHTPYMISRMGPLNPRVRTMRCCLLPSPEADQRHVVAPDLRRRQKNYLGLTTGLENGR